MREYEWLDVHWDSRVRVEGLALEWPERYNESVQYFHRVTVEDTNLRFLMSMNYTSQILFLCPSCDSTYTPSWFEGPTGLSSCSVLKLGQDNVFCNACGWACRQSGPSFFIRDNMPYYGSVKTYHRKVRNSEELRAVLEESLDDLAVNVLDAMVITDELTETLTRIKGRAVSEALRAKGY